MNNSRKKTHRFTMCKSKSKTLVRKYSSQRKTRSQAEKETDSSNSEQNADLQEMADTERQKI